MATTHSMATIVATSSVPILRDRMAPTRQGGLRRAGLAASQTQAAGVSRGLMMFMVLMMALVHQW